MNEPEKPLRAELAELRREVAALSALLRTSLQRKRSRKAAEAKPTEAAPDVRKSVRDKMLRSASRSR